MIDYAYLKPKDLEETFRLLGEHGRKAELIAGGTDVMVVVRQSNRSPEVLISLRGIEELRYIHKNDDYHIGALTTHRMIETSPLMKNELTALNQGASQVGSVQVRNVATIGGNICNAAPSADTAAPTSSSPSSITTRWVMRPSMGFRVSRTTARPPSHRRTPRSPICPPDSG